MSDRVPDERLPTLEERMDDMRAVMDAAGSERAAVFGASEGGNMAVLFAATYPERTLALVTFGIFAKRVWSPDYPWAPTPEERSRFFEVVENNWDGEMDLAELAPSAADDPEFMRRLMRYLRRSASPGRGPCARAHEHRDRHPRGAADGRRADARDAPARRRGLERRGGPLDRSADPGRPLRRARRRGPPSARRRPGRRPRRDRGVPDRRPAGSRAGPRPRDAAVHRHRRLDRARRVELATRAGASCSSGTTSACAGELEHWQRPRARHGGRRLPRVLRRPRASDPLRPRSDDSRSRPGPRDPRRRPHRRVRTRRRTRCAASPSTSAPASPRTPAPARRSSRAP